MINHKITVILSILLLVLSIDTTVAESSQGGGVGKCYINEIINGSLNSKEIDCNELYEIQQQEQQRLEQDRINRIEQIEQNRKQIRENLKQIDRNLSHINEILFLIMIFVFLNICVLLYGFYKDYKNKRRT